MITEYRKDKLDWEYSPTSKRSANWMSEYTIGRKYKFSNYQQVINAMALEVDRMNKALGRHLSNKFPKTFKYDTIDVIHTIDDPKASAISLTGETILPYVQANLSDYQWHNGTEYKPIAFSEYTNYEDWWYETIPTGVKDIDAILDGMETGWINPEYQIVVDKWFNAPIPLYLHLTSSTGSFIFNKYGKSQKPSYIILNGIDSNNILRREMVPFFFSTYNRSRFRWKKLNTIEFTLWDDMDKFSTQISSYFDSSMLPYIEDKSLSYEDDNRISRPVLWEWDNNENRLLQKEFSAANNSDMHAGITDINTVAEYELMFEDGGSFSKVINVDSIIPSEDDNNLYISTQGFLIGYSKLIKYPTVVAAASNMKTYDPIVNLNVDVGPGKLTIKGLYNRIQLNKKIHSYRFRIIKGSTSLICDSPNVQLEDNSTWKTYDGTWDLYNLGDKYGFYTPIVSYGDGSTLFDEDIIVAFEAKLQDGSIETDTFIVEAQRKYPIFQYELPHLGLNLSYSTEGILSLADASEFRRIEFRNDTYMLDSNSGKAIFAHGYNLIQRDSNNVELRPFNVFNELDQHGDIHSLPRKLGEKSYNYIKRLNYAFYNSFNSTHNGLVNAISTELGLPVIDAIRIESTDRVQIKITEKSIHIGQSSTILKDQTIQNIIDWANALSGITAILLDPDYSDLPALGILNSNNEKVYLNQIYNNTDKISPKLDLDEYITNVEIPGYVSVNTKSWLFDKSISASFFALGKNTFYIEDGKIIFLNDYIKPNQPVTITTQTNYAVLKSSSVLVSSIFDDIESHFSYGMVSDDARKTIEASEMQHPNKWGS